MTLILYLGIGFFVLSGIAPIAEILSSLLNWLSTFLEWFTRSLAGIPGTCAGGLSLLPSQVILLYATGVLILFYLGRRTVHRMYMLIASLILLLGISGFREYRISKHNQVYIFDMQGETAIAFVNGRGSVLYGDVGQPEDIEGLPNEIEPFFRRNKLKIPLVLGPGNTGAFTVPWHQAVYSPGLVGDYFMYRGVRTFVLREWDRQQGSKLPDLEMDVIVLSDNPRVSVTELISHFSVSQIVTDGSCFLRYSRDMKEGCREAGIPFHSTREEGCLSY